MDAAGHDPEDDLDELEEDPLSEEKGRLFAEQLIALHDGDDERMAKLGEQINQLERRERGAGA